MASQTRKINRTKISATFNLNEILKRNVSNRSARRQYRELINDTRFKTEFARTAIDRIIDRTLNENQSFTGEDFGSYSDSYAKSAQFKFFNKSKSKVTLRLTGEMQASILISRLGDNKVTIAIDDEDQAVKAHGHITGNVGKRRDFFGLNDKEQDDIFRELIQDYGATIRRTEALDLILNTLAVEQAANAQSGATVTALLFNEDFDG